MKDDTRIISSWRTPALVIGFGSLIALIAFGPRSTLGFFLTPLSSANHWGRDVFAFALAVQNLLWGVGQPLGGIIADRFGSVRVLCGGALLYALGLALMAHATSAPLLDLSAGVLIGFGLAGCSFPVVLAAFGKIVPLQYRSIAFGFGTAAGSFGQFLYSPVAVALMDTFGWQQTLIIFAVSMLAVLPLSIALATPPSELTHGAGSQSLRQALGEAFAHRSYVLLVLGFFTCGFQLQFITVHMPSYLVDRGLSAQVGGWTIATIGLFNIVGSVTAGWLGDRMPKRYLLSIDLFRARCGDPRVHFISGHAGHLHRVRRGHGADVAVHRAADQRHHRTDVRHALAGDARRFCLLQSPGRRLSRRLARRHRVRPHRLVQHGVVARDPVRRSFGADQHADRGKTGGAPCRRAGVNARRQCPETIFSYDTSLKQDDRVRRPFDSTGRGARA